MNVLNIWSTSFNFYSLKLEHCKIHVYVIYKHHKDFEWRERERENPLLMFLDSKAQINFQQMSHAVKYSNFGKGEIFFSLGIL
jgi:hypothetical protein